MEVLTLNLFCAWFFHLKVVVILLHVHLYHVCLQIAMLGKREITECAVEILDFQMDSFFVHLEIATLEKLF